MKENQIWTINKTYKFLTSELEHVEICEGESVVIEGIEAEFVSFSYDKRKYFRIPKPLFMALFHTNEVSKDFIKADQNKTEWDLIPYEELEDVVKVLQMGAKKYKRDNWKNCDNPSRYVNALLRHVISYVKGDKIDSESGLSHLAHAMCNCLFLMWMDKKGK